MLWELSVNPRGILPKARICYSGMLAESGRLGKQLMRKSAKTEQTEAQEKTIRVLSEMSVRLQTIEHRMDVRHIQPPPVTKKKTSERVDFRENM